MSHASSNHYFSRAADASYRPLDALPPAAQALAEGSPVSLVLHAIPEYTAFLEVLAAHLTQQLGSAVQERVLVIDATTARRARGRRGRPPRSIERLASDLLAGGLVDRVIEGRIGRERREQLANRYCEPASRPLLHKQGGCEAIWSGLEGLEAARHDHVLHLASPVFFHCSGPSWLTAAVEALSRRPELSMLVTSCGPPATEAPPGDRDALLAVRTRGPHGRDTTGYFLCDRRRLFERLSWDAAWRGALTFEQWVSRGRGTRAELCDHGSWAVRAGYTDEPFPERAAALAQAIAQGSYPREQRGRYDIRLDRALDRDAWTALLRSETDCGRRSESKRAQPLGYALPSIREAPATWASTGDFAPESLPAPTKEPWGVLLAPYFTKNGNPIYGREKCKKDQPELIEPWWSDVKKLGLHARIFHDELSPTFVDHYTTDQIRFEHAEIPQKVSCNDYRFVIFRDWLRQHPGVEYAFCTDMFDLRINKNPFDVVGGGRWIYAGAQPGRIGRNLYVRSKLYSAYGCSFPELADKIVLNAGILGGPRDLLLPCLDALVYDLLEAIRKNPSGNHNMGVFNRVLYSMDRVWAHGAPLHSEFRAQDRKADVCFVHK